MTQEGLDKLKKELADAIAQRPVISAQIAEARDKGDLSENAEYESAREAQGLLELNIAKLQNLVANARVIDEKQIGTDKVQMLNKVKVKNLSNGQIMNFTLVGESEADFKSGKLAVEGLCDMDPRGRHRRCKGAGRHHQVRDSRNYPLVLPFKSLSDGNNFHKDSQGGNSFVQGCRKRRILCIP